jgi:NAD(P)-dependent dehydrogenase (short-subunit alcohol dehydrogenase family)
LKLDGKPAAVIGSTKGIGRAIAQSLANEGATAVVNGRSEETVQADIAEMKAPDRLRAVAPDGAEQFIRAVKGGGSLDILVNNLSIFEVDPFKQITDDHWRSYFEINVLSGVRLARALLPRLQGRRWRRANLLLICRVGGTRRQPAGRQHEASTSFKTGPRKRE